MQLLLGCGSRRTKQMYERDKQEWDGLVTCDINPDHHPDVVADLNHIPWPWGDQTASEIHAYEVLEHLGHQGDWKFFFQSFGEVWRILQPGGLFFASVPSYNSHWAWGDPSHTRVLTEGSLVFLDQAVYQEVGKTAMSDFRRYWKHTLRVVFKSDDGDLFRFCLARCEDEV